MVVAHRCRVDADALRKPRPARRHHRPSAAPRTAPGGARGPRRAQGRRGGGVPRAAHRRRPARPPPARHAARRARSRRWPTDETATVLVEVRSIRSRPVRRRGMKPLVEATVADATGLMKATFFNQPWLERHYRPGTRLMLTGKYQSRGRVPRQRTTRRPRPSTAVGDDGRDVPGDEGHHLDADPRAGPRAPRRGARGPRAAPGAPAARRRASRTGRGAVIAAHVGDREARAAPAGLRRAAARPARSSCACAPSAARSTHAEPLTDAADAELTSAGSTERLPFEPTGDQLAAIAEIDADLALDRPMQRLLMGEVGSGKTVVALHAMLRAVEHGTPGGAHGADRDARRAALRDAADADAGRAVPAALLTGSTPPRGAPTCSASSRRGELPLDRRHARADRGHRRVRRPRGRRRRRAAPLRRAPARGAGRQGAGRARAARAAHDRDADPADAAPARLRRARRHRAARAAARPPADRDARRLGRARARARLRAHPRGAARRPPGVRRLPARRGVRGAAGPRGDGRVRAPARRRSSRTSTSSCCTARCGPREKQRGDGSASPPARPTCSSRRR